MATPQDGSLLALIVDQDTATGMLLTGVGQVDLRKRTNYLIVDDSEWAAPWGGVGGHWLQDHGVLLSGPKGRVPTAALPPLRGRRPAQRRRSSSWRRRSGTSPPGRTSRCC